jgi:pyridinium-3,5-biscarboxylic acid mononucleotide synthase
MHDSGASSDGSRSRLESKVSGSFSGSIRVKKPVAMSEANGLLELLHAVAEGRVSPERAVDRLAVTAAPRARIDFDRDARCGFPEVVFASGKSPEDAAAIAEAIYERSGRVLVTRASAECGAAVMRRVPGATWHERSRVVTAERAPRPRTGLVVVLSAGTADVGVAEEAALTADIVGAKVETFIDVGVAGLQRVLAVVPRLREASAVVVVAGMEGALASVAGGLIDRPVIAVPTSVGYGAAFGGIAALLGMLNACTPNVTVVNIDNGFGAGYVAALVNRMRCEGRATA